MARSTTTTLQSFTTTASVRHAAGILDAWRANNLDRFWQELATAATVEPSSAEDPDECERAELLGGIAQEMKNAVASGDTEAARVYFNLLHHLADPVTM